MKYGIASKKVKTRRYSIGLLIQKSKGSSAFDEQKVKNIAIEYRLQSIFPKPACKFLFNKMFYRMLYFSEDKILNGGLH